MLFLSIIVLKFEEKQGFADVHFKGFADKLHDLLNWREKNKRQLEKKFEQLFPKLLVEVHRTALGGSVPDNPELS